MWEIKEHEFLKKLFSLNNFLISVEITYVNYVSLRWTKLKIRKKMKATHVDCIIN